VLNSIPLATLHKVDFPRLSTGKRIIINGQEMGKVYRTYMIFDEPFWRGNYSGYGTFSPEFPFNEMTDITPESE
jgi:monoamine oxidase